MMFSAAGATCCCRIHYSDFSDGNKPTWLSGSGLASWSVVGGVLTCSTANAAINIPTWPPSGSRCLQRTFKMSTSGGRGAFVIGNASNARIEIDGGSVYASGAAFNAISPLPSPWFSGLAEPVDVSVYTCGNTIGLRFNEKYFKAVPGTDITPLSIFPLAGGTVNLHECAVNADGMFTDGAGHDGDFNDSTHTRRIVTSKDYCRGHCDPDRQGWWPLIKHDQIQLTIPDAGWSSCSGSCAVERVKRIGSFVCDFYHDNGTIGTRGSTSYVLDGDFGWGSNRMFVHFRSPVVNPFNPFGDMIPESMLVDWDGHSSAQAPRACHSELWLHDYSANGRLTFTGTSPFFTGQGIVPRMQHWYVDPI